MENHNKTTKQRHVSISPHQNTVKNHLPKTINSFPLKNINISSQNFKKGIGATTAAHVHTL